MNQLAIALAIKKIGELPALPAISTKVLDLIDDPESSSQDICNVLVKDKVLTTKVLRLVNSAYYGVPRKVPTISEAITVLGLQTLRTLVLGVSVYKTISSEGSKGILDPEQLWRHSIATSVASRIIAVKLNYRRMEQAFVAGLLHDIGKIILNQFMTNEYSEVLKKIDEEDISLLRAEKQVLDFDHALVGKLVAEKWNLPNSLVEPIAFHHSPFKAEEYIDLTCITHLGNAAAVVAGFGMGNDKDYHLDMKVLNKAKFTFDEVVSVASEVSKQVKSDMLL